MNLSGSFQFFNPSYELGVLWLIRENIWEVIYRK